MRDKIQNILALAVNAPSGDNSQPWAFKFVNEQEIEIFNLPKADDTLYNFRQRGSYISHGALLENISILSGPNGLDAAISVFPDINQANLIARVIFSKVPPRTETLAGAIANRATNRKPHNHKPLNENFYREILSFNENSAAQVKLDQNNDDIIKLAKELSLNEKLLLENYHIHKKLFAFIRWSHAEEKKKRDGLYIKTFELKPPQELAFKLFSHWPIINFLNNFKMANLVAKDTQKVYASSACYGLITIQNNQPNSFIEAGRLFEKIWLTAAKYNISFQPTTALLYLQQKINEGQADEFSKKQIVEITHANQVISQLFKISEEIPAMLFRIGYAEPPTAVSLKKPPMYI